MTPFVSFFQLIIRWWTKQPPSLFFSQTDSFDDLCIRLTDRFSSIKVGYTHPDSRTHKQYVIFLAFLTGTYVIDQQLFSCRGWKELCRGRWTLALIASSASRWTKQVEPLFLPVDRTAAQSNPEIISTQNEVITYLNHTAKLSCIIQNKNRHHVTRED